MRRIGVHDRIRRHSNLLWSALIQGAVRAMLVVVSDVLDEHLLELTTPEDEEAVVTLSTKAGHETLGEGVRPRGSDRGLDDSHALRTEHLVEASRELRVPVPDEEPGCSGSFGQDEARIARAG